MAYEFKRLSDVNVIESISDTLNVLVEDNGEVVKIAANNLVPEDVVVQSEMEEAIAAIGTAPVVEELAENAHVLVEQNGAYARVSKDKVGVMSWNDLQDRPFGEEKTVIEWDGVIGDRPNFTQSGSEYVLVGEPITREELQAAKVWFSGTELEEVMCVPLNEFMTTAVRVSDQAVIIVSLSEDADGMSAGTYFIRERDTYGYVGHVSKIEYSAVKKLDPKFVTNVQPLVFTADYQFPETDMEKFALLNKVKTHAEASLPIHFKYTTGSGSGAAYVTVPTYIFYEDAYDAFYVSFLSRSSTHTFNFKECTYTEET